MPLFFAASCTIHNESPNSCGSEQSDSYSSVGLGLIKHDRLS